MGRWLLLTLSVSIAGCGGHAQLRTEVDALRAEITVMEARQAETQQRQQQPIRVRQAVRPRPVAEADENSGLPLSEFQLVAQVQAISDEICACKNLSCATQAMKRMQRLKEQDKPSEQAMEQILEIFEQMTKCMTTLTQAKTP